MTGLRFTLRAQVALSLFAAAGVAACAGILGIDQRGLDPELADGSTLEGGSAEGGSGQDATATADGLASADSPGSAMHPDANGSDAANLDASNDGPNCPNPCPLATGLNHPFLMTSDANNVYWTEFGDDLGSGNGFVKGCAVTGCGAVGPTVYGMGLTNPRGVAVDAQNIYFGTATYGGVNGGIWKCALSGCSSPTRLATAGIPFGVGVDATYVYWVDNDDATVHKVAKSGAGNDIVLYDAGSGLIIEPGQCVVDGPFVYLMDRNADCLRVSANGGEPTFLGTSFFGAYYGITTDPTNVYFGGSGVVLSSPKSVVDGAAPIADTVADPTALAFDPATSKIYWANWGSGNGNDGTVGKMSTDGGAQQVLQSSLASPEDVTVSGNYVLWLSNGRLSDGGNGTDPSTGAVWRATK
jgi:hypothetical protein